LPKKNEILAGFAWASVLVTPWLWNMHWIEYNAGSIVAEVFFLIVAILASLYQTGTNIPRKQ
jgi:hypothetical protein